MVIIGIIIIIIICFLYYRAFPLYSESSSSDVIKILETSHFVSVVVACRNEEKNILRLIHDLEKQEFNQYRFEIIIVDDHSTDSTLEVLKIKEIENDALCVLSMKDGERGKKQAIRKAISVAKGDLILCTDADCRVGEKWIKTMVNYFSEDKILFVSAPVEYICEKGIFQKFQYLEFLALVASGATAIIRNKPLFCNGANLAFRKETYNEIDKIELLRFATDDVSLLNYIHNYYVDAICFAKNQDAIVRTNSNRTFLEFISQKIRWINFSKSEKNIHASHVGTIVFIMNLLIITFFVLAIFNYFYDSQLILLSLSKYIFMALFLYKFFVDYNFLFPFLIFFRKRKLALYILPFEIIYSFYTSLIVPLSFIMHPKWKERTRY